MGLAAVILGIFGIVLAFIPSLGVTQMVGVVLGIVALILGVIGRRKAREEGGKTGMATAGIVLGIISMVFAALLFAACTYCQHKMAESFRDPKVQEQFRRGFQEGIRRGIERRHRAAPARRIPSPSGVTPKSTTASQGPSPEVGKEGKPSAEPAPLSAPGSP